MKYLIFTNTPAHVHLYKHAVRKLDDRGHDVLVLGRRYSCTEDLLEYYDLPYRIYGTLDTTKYSLFRQLPKHYLGAFRAARRFDPDCIFGYGGYAAHTGFVVRTPTMLILDSEPTTLDHIVSRPFARAIFTPHAFEKDLGAHHYRFRGFKELAYLHPDIYEPSVDIRDALDLGPDERYVLLRFNAFGSHHDIGHSGFSVAQRRDLIERLGESGTVLVSDEGGEMDLETTDARPFDLHPALVHDAIADAHLLVTDTQTMATEAALLGTPAIRSNSFVSGSDMGNFRELGRTGLIYNLEAFDEVLDTALDILSDDDVKDTWRRKRDEYLTDKVNLTDLILEVAANVETLDRIDAISSHSPETTT